MIMIFCPGCGRSRRLDKRPKGILTCKNCGAKGGVGTRKLWAISQPEKEGLEADAAKRVTMGGLVWLALAQNYKLGWATIKYELLFGSRIFPGFPGSGDIVDIDPPSAALVRWCIRDRAKRDAMLRKIEANQRES